MTDIRNNSIEPGSKGHILFKGIKPKTYRRGRFYVEDYSKKALSPDDTPPDESYCKACGTKKMFRGRFEITQIYDRTKEISHILELQQLQIELLQNILLHDEKFSKLESVISKSTCRKVKSCYLSRI